MIKINFGDSANQLIDMLSRLDRGEAIRETDRANIMLGVQALRQLHDSFDGAQLRAKLENWRR